MTHSCASVIMEVHMNGAGRVLLMQRLRGYPTARTVFDLRDDWRRRGERIGKLEGRVCILAALLLLSGVTIVLLLV